MTIEILICHATVTEKARVYPSVTVLARAHKAFRDTLSRSRMAERDKRDSSDGLEVSRSERVTVTSRLKPVCHGHDGAMV